MIVSGFKLSVKIEFFFLLILLIIVMSTYFTTCNWVRTVASKVSFYSTYSTTFSQVKTIVNKTSIFYFTNLYCLGKTTLISINKQRLVQDLIRGELIYIV